MHYLAVEINVLQVYTDTFFIPAHYPFTFIPTLAFYSLSPRPISCYLYQKSLTSHSQN